MTENPNFPIDDWRYEVANGDTTLGYAEWLLHKVDDATQADEPDDEPELHQFTVTVGADVRAYFTYETDAASAEQAREFALDLLRDNPPSWWTWSVESIQGEVTMDAEDQDDPDADHDFVPVKFMDGQPDYSELEAFAWRMARFTTPEDEVAGTENEHAAEDFVAELDDDRLCSEYATFMEMVREARKLMQKEG